MKYKNKNNTKLEYINQICEAIEDLADTKARILLQAEDLDKLHNKLYNQKADIKEALCLLFEVKNY